MLILVVAAAFTAAGTATADPSVSAKQAQAQQVMGQIQQLDSSLQRAKNAYDSATAQLGVIEHNLKINKIGLHAAREPRQVAGRARAPSRRDLHDA